MLNRRLMKIAIAAAFCLLAAIPATADDIDVMDLVPDDSLAVLRVTGLGDTWDALKSSPVIEKLLAEGPQEWRDGLAEAQQNIAQFEAMANLDLEETVVSMLGQDAVLAVMGMRRSVFVAVNSDPDKLVPAVNTLTRLLTGFQRFQQADAEVYMGVNIRSLSAPNRRRGDWYYCIADGTFIVSRQIDLVKQIVDKTKELREEKEDAVETEIRQAFDAAAPDALLRLYVDTDHIGQLVSFSQAFGARAESMAMANLLEYLDTLLPLTNYAMMSVTPTDEGVEFRETISIDEAKLSEDLKALVPVETSFELLKFTPPNTAAAFVVNIDKPALWNYIRKVVGEADRRVLGRLDTYADMIAGVFGSTNMETLLLKFGDETGVFINVTDTPSVPALTLALELSDGGNEIPVAMRSVAGMAVAAIRMQRVHIPPGREPPKPPVTLDTADHKNVQLTTIRITDRTVERSVNPTLFAMQDTMFTGTNLEAAKAIIDAYQPEKELQLPEVDGILTATGTIDFSIISKLFDEHREFVVANWRMNELEADNLSLILSVLDKLRFHVSYNAGRIDRVAVLSFAE